MSNPERAPRKNMYETFCPEERFIEMANAVVDKYNPNHETDDPIAIDAWWEDQERNHYNLKKTEETEYSMFGIVRHNVSYALHYFAPGEPDKPPVARYALDVDLTVENGKRISPIRLVDKSGLPFDQEELNHEAAENALRIVSDALGPVSVDMLQNKFDEKFLPVVGAYVLSKHAVTKSNAHKAPLVTRKAAEHAAFSHAQRMMSIEDQELRKSARRNKNDPEMHEEVETAVWSQPLLGRRGSTYLDIDTTKVSVSVAARLGGSWKNTVRPKS